MSIICGLRLLSICQYNWVLIGAYNRKFHKWIVVIWLIASFSIHPWLIFMFYSFNRTLNRMGSLLRQRIVYQKQFKKWAHRKSQSFDLSILSMALNWWISNDANYHSCAQRVFCSSTVQSGLMRYKWYRKFRLGLIRSTQGEPKDTLGHIIDHFPLSCTRNVNNSHKRHPINLNGEACNEKCKVLWNEYINSTSS